jgi:hypothetical protein
VAAVQRGLRHRVRCRAASWRRDYRAHRLGLGRRHPAIFRRSTSEDTIAESGHRYMRFGVVMRDRKFLYGVLCGGVLMLAGVAIAHKNPENENDTVKPLIAVPGSALCSTTRCE